MLGNVKTSKNAQDVLNKAFAGNIRAKVMYLKENPFRSSKRSKHVAKYLWVIKSLVDELEIIDYVIHDVDLIIDNTTITYGNYIFEGA